MEEVEAEAEKAAQGWEAVEGEGSEAEEMARAVLSAVTASAYRC